MKSLLVLICLTCLPTSLVTNQLAADEPTRSTYTLEDRKRMKVLMGTFRRASTEAAQRDEAVEEIFEIGGIAVKEFAREVKRQSSRDLADYGKDFRRQASRLYQQRYRAISGQEVNALRQKVLALKDNPELTKAMIVEQADPAMKKLTELLVLSAEEVLEDEGLRTQREKLSKLGDYLLRARQYQAADNPPADDEQATEAEDFEDFLKNSEKLEALLAMPTSNSNRSVLASNVRLATQLDLQEVRCIRACNMMRVILGLNALAIDLRLCAASRDHSADMAKLKFFAHESPVPGKTSFSDRATNFRTTASGENIFAGISDGEKTNRGWFHSPGHHKNMLANHARIGVGRSDKHFTQMFGR